MKYTIGTVALSLMILAVAPWSAGAKTVNCPKPSSAQSTSGFYIGGLSSVLVQAAKPMSCSAAYDLLGEVSMKFGVKDGRYRAKGRVWKVTIGPGQYGEGDAMILKSRGTTVSAQLGG